MTDLRTHFANASVAHSSLAGTVTAPRFSDGTLKRVACAIADIHHPGSDRLQRQVLMGEPVRVLETVDGLSFARAEHNGFVGYISAPLADWIRPTHVVRNRATLLFDAPDLKCPNPVNLSLGSYLTITWEEDRFARTIDGKYVFADHLMPVDQPEPDPVAVAERLLGTPYLWGGNSAFGIDCSGLVQAGCLACGIPCPGDSDLQQDGLGAALPEDAPLHRGDLLFWKGHVAWVADSDHILHSNAFRMAVTYEPLQDAINRIEVQGGGPVTARKRLGAPL